MKEYAKEFYKSKRWHNIREIIIERDLGLCQVCLRNGFYTKGKIVHHIKPVTPENIGDPKITLNTDNLELVCYDCHEKIHRRQRGEISGRYSLDELGRIVRMAD